MAREAYRSLYGDLKKLKDDSLLKDPANGTGDDDELFQLLMTVSDWVDNYCNRYFYPRQQTLEFDGDGTTRLLIPDLIAVDSIKEDTTDDKTFNLTFAANDYWLEPYNAEPTEHWGRPYTLIRIREHGNEDAFTKGEQHFQIAGRWGYREFKEDSGTDTNESLDATETSVDVLDGTQFEIGQTLLIDTEQMLITNISTNTLTCTR